MTASATPSIDGSGFNAWSSVTLLGVALDKVFDRVEASFSVCFVCLITLWTEGFAEPADVPAARAVAARAAVAYGSSGVTALEAPIGNGGGGGIGKCADLCISAW